MLQIRDLSKSFGSKTLFEDATVFLGDRDRVGLIGANGSGKSTLIKLILGEEHADEGAIQVKKNIKIGHLAQELPKFQNRTVFDEVLRLDGRREEILARKKGIEEELESNHSEALLQEYSEVLQEFDAFDEYRLPSRAEQILEGVGFQKTDFHRNLSEFSGGWLMRVALSRILLLQPELLILDEPTNHLDLESLLWLEEFLKTYPGAILLVSHDRAFQNRLINSVWEIDQKKITAYSGDLDAFVTQKEERLKVMSAARVGQEAKIAELQSFVDRFGAKATKARQAQSRMKQIEKLEDQMIDLPESRAEVRFTFPPSVPSGKEVLTVKDAGLSFGEKLVFKNFNWILARGSRVAIVGVNGAGKTSLLKTLTGHLKLTQGSIKVGHQVAQGYYSQIQAESLNGENTIFTELQNTAPALTISQLRGVAGAFLFSGDAIEKKIKVLSGGEKARVALAKLLLIPNNFLVLDEPTNHLDVESRAVLSDALLEYPGTLLLVSHDRDFVAPLVNELLEIQDQRITPLISTYEEYLAKKVQETREKMKGPAKRETSASTPQKSTDLDHKPKSDKPSNNQIKYWERDLKQSEALITKLEARQAEINQLLLDDSVLSNPTRLREVIDEQTSNQKKLDETMTKWEDLSMKLGV